MIGGVRVSMVRACTGEVWGAQHDAGVGRLDEEGV